MVHAEPASLAAKPRPMTMAERLAAAAARVPEADPPLGSTKAKGGGKKVKKGKKEADGAATASAAPPPSAPVRGGIHAVHMRVAGGKTTNLTCAYRVLI